MADLQEADDILVEYGEEEAPVEAAAESGDAKKGHYVGIHASGFRDFLLKPELLRAVVDNAFEHPSEVQHECIPQALNGMDVICQAQSGMGKTAVFVLTTLHLVDPESDNVQVLVLTHVRELAFQLCVEYQRFCKFMPGVKAMVVYGGVDYRTHAKMLAEEKPQIVVGTPGRVWDLINRGDLKVDKLSHFVLDECDKLLDQLDMRDTVQKIFVKTPLDKQVMMFSATLSKEIRPVCRKFCQDVRVSNKALEIYVDSESKLTLHGLQQYYVRLTEEEKTRRLNSLLDAVEFNQVVIFVSSVSRAKVLNQLLNECNFPSICVHGRLPQQERTAKYEAFRKYESRILVSTDLFGRGIDIERVNIVINYDFPADADQYLHRVGRAGRFGTKGLAISFVSSPENEEVFAEVQKRFEVSVPEMPTEIDASTYMS